MVYPRGKRLLESPRDTRNMQWRHVSQRDTSLLFCNIAEDRTTEIATKHRQAALTAAKLQGTLSCHGDGPESDIP